MEKPCFHSSHSHVRMADITGFFVPFSLNSGLNHRLSKEILTENLVEMVVRNHSRTDQLCLATTKINVAICEVRFV